MIQNGFISKLWRDTSDIKFVRQVVGHAKISTTSLYVKHMSDREKRERIKGISSPENLTINENFH
jgi:site-specific recombinase XerD